MRTRKSLRDNFLGDFQWLGKYSILSYTMKRHIGILLVFLFIFFTNKEIVMAKVKEIQLPAPVYRGEMSLEEAILKRRSQRGFLQKDLGLGQISQLLWAAQGITAKRPGFAFRAAPSAGALYPMEIYLMSKDGLFHYIPSGHKLGVLDNSDLRDSLAAAALGQDSVRQAPVNIIICAVYNRITGKYGKRGIRYTHIEAGHIAQNVHLEAVALGLGSVSIGAFDDEQVKDVLSLAPELEPIYIIPVGYIE
ncbi:MAG: SagB/ThcOx family dehydrogenase [Candidatus Omnitrophota bacterium]